MIGTCKLASGATPFGVAMLGAIADYEFPLIIPWILIGVSSGIKFGPLVLAKYLLTSIIFIVLKAFIKGKSKASNTAKILVSTAIAETIILLFSNTLIYDAVMAAFMSTTTAVFYLIFSEGLPILLDLDFHKIDSYETLMAGGIIVAVLISTFESLSVFGLSIRSIICILIVMLLGWRRKMAVGMIAGASISLVLGIMGLANPGTVATYVICGMLSGVLSKFGRLGAIVGFVVGNAIWVWYQNASTEIIIPIGEIAVSSFALLFLPNKVIDFVDKIFNYDNCLEGRDAVGMLAESTIYKLEAVSDVAKDMAQNVETEEKKDESKTYEFVKILNDNVCRKCENFEKCWKNNYHAMYETVFNALEILNETGEVLASDIQNDICTNKKLFAEGINFSYEIHKVNKEWQSKVAENKILVAKQLRGVSKAIENVKEELKEDVKDEKFLGTGLRMEVGIASSKKKNSNVSGDSTIFSKLNDGRVLLALSDGMGSGESAKKASEKVLELLEKYLNAGLDRNIALDLVNSYMLLGENNENFATLDAIIFNPTNAKAEIIKFGAPPTFIKRFDDVKLISSKSLPVGADTESVFEVFEDTLELGDTIAIVSDGVSDAKSEKEVWVKNSFSQIKKSDSKRTADIILGEAMDENLGINKDDMTVIIAKIK